ncbi:hypothetical protein [Alkalisalibacterium limincola]|uniref:hypothetical protein n=1 Tax=Alkalisalibacterium limincola TaxID=2699169 RepID=UPI00164F7939|nr:hypothetical protein [Alkalisalibacterium limincola]
MSRSERHDPQWRLRLRRVRRLLVYGTAVVLIALGVVVARRPSCCRWWSATRSGWRHG